MPAITLTEVRVHRRAISSQFGPFGQGGKWIKLLSARMKGAAAEEAPKRSYQLARSHYTSFRRGTNAYVAVADVENRAPHASYVHLGTPRRAPGAKGAISGNPWLVLPPWGEYGKVVTNKPVAGQKANPWLERACSQIAISVGAIKVGP